ncbi:MAG: NTP transferase domain-containing protein, partial [Deltaproteobacteria bacterium]
MKPDDSARISPTAHYTSYVWFRNGLSHPALVSPAGRALHLLLRPLNVAYERFGHRVITDRVGAGVPGGAGPLAGLHAGLSAAAHPWVVTVPCDSPFLPFDLVSR